MAYGESNGQTHDSNTLRVKYRENSCRCYLATIANYLIVCCETVLSAVLATAWFLVYRVLSTVFTRATLC